MSYIFRFAEGKLIFNFSVFVNLLQPVLDGLLGLGSEAGTQLVFEDIDENFAEFLKP
jgi:hypothetical protein